MRQVVHPCVPARSPAWCCWVLVEGQTRSMGRRSFCGTLGRAGQRMCVGRRRKGMMAENRPGVQLRGLDCCLTIILLPLTATPLRRVACPLFSGLTSSFPASLRPLPGVHFSVAKFSVYGARTLGPAPDSRLSQQPCVLPRQMSAGQLCARCCKVL